MPEFPSMLELGSIGKAHGIKGEITLDWHGGEAPRKGQLLYVQEPAGTPGLFRILSARIHKGRPIVMLDGINDRNAAEKLTGRKIFVERKSLSQPLEDEAWLADLVGCNIFLPDGEAVGVLDHVEFPANQQVWVIKGVKGNEILFPAQPCFIDFLDPENGKIGINPPPGLLDIYNA